MKIDDFRKLHAWQLIDELRRSLLAVFAQRPASLDFKLRDQALDAVGSAARNTSEGFGRFRPSEFARFLEFARGSLAEVQDCLIELKEKAFIDQKAFGEMWLLSKRAIGTNTRLHQYLKGCAERGDQPWRQNLER
jgi:four helix bundle protein